MQAKEWSNPRMPAAPSAVNIPRTYEPVVKVTQSEEKADSPIIPSMPMFITPDLSAKTSPSAARRIGIERGMLAARIEVMMSTMSQGAASTSNLILLLNEDVALKPSPEAQDR